ncbi:hypothetical protein RRF57_004841 [Xylaria bambusicola]|uniref:Uncharacterized protein n=1 Tax=Xylaria bambusicola TaxID=326684 RepID=A0AAN7UPH5_9PEZI
MANQVCIAAVFLELPHDGCFLGNQLSVIKFCIQQLIPGGGTVDLISYEITSTKPSLELAELVPGKGGMAGSLGLNKRFAEAVQNVVGDEQWVTLKKGVGWSKASNEFDKVVKTAFRGDIDENFYISFPFATLEDDEDEDLVGNCWTMSGRHVKEIFDPLVTDIIRLVEEQVKNAQVKVQGRPIKVSNYLDMNSNRELHTEVFRGSFLWVDLLDGAWAAIVKGAVLSRMNNCPAVTSTQAVRHYGTTGLTPYVTMRDEGQPQELCPLDGVNRVRTNTWYINIGEDLKRNRTIKFPFYRKVAVPYFPRELIFKDQLITSEAKFPPRYPGPHTKVNCTVTADFRNVKKAQFMLKRGLDGTNYIEVHYKLVLSTDAANMKFSVEFDGKNLGSVDASYE